MRRKLLIASLATLGLAGAAGAAEFSEVDADSNSLVTLQELQAIAPEVTRDEFGNYDGDADGGLNENEFAIWNAANPGEEEAY
jgi:hypothetical protein